MLSFALAIVDILIVLGLIIVAIGPKRCYFKIRRLFTSQSARPKVI